MKKESVCWPIWPESMVANRFASLMDELDRLKELDLSNVQPVVIFAEEP